MKCLYGLLIMVFSFFIASQAPAQSSITCSTLNDVYIDQYGPNTNFNDKTRVLISEHLTKGIARGLWKFDIPAGLNPSQIQSAVLHLSGCIHCPTGGTGIDVCCHALNAAFGEDSATWNLQAGGNYDNTTCAAGTLPAGNDWESTIDVTTLLKQKLDKVRANGMLMKKTNETVAGFENIASRESTDPEDFGAYIVINTIAVTTTTTTSTIPATATTTTTTIVNATTTTSTATTAMKLGETVCPVLADLTLDEWKPDENLNYYERVVLATNHNIHHGIARGLFLFGIPKELKEADVGQAQICLSACHHCGGGDGGEIGFYALNAPFNEAADTWNSLKGGSWDNSTFSQAVLPAGVDWNTAVNGQPPWDVKCLDVTGLMKGNLIKARDNGVMMRFLDEAQVPPTWQSVASRESTDPLDFAPYLVIRTNLCPAEVLFDNETAVLDRLRGFRDGVLSRTSAGRQLTALYYRYAAAIAELLENSPMLKRQSRATAELMLPYIGLPVDGVKQKP